MRAYVKGFDRDSQFTLDRSEYDAWHLLQGGFRADWTLAGERSVTLQGDLYAGRLGQRAVTTTSVPPFSVTTARDAPVSGGNLLARWSGRVGAAADAQVQVYYDRTHRDERPVAETRDTFDLDFQQRQRGWGRHDVVWGLGYRISSGRITAVEPSAFDPADRTDALYSAFVQDDISLIPRRLRGIVGTKIEHNDYSGVEFQPTGRLVWTVNPSNTIVAAVTRAVRTPSRVETDYTTTSVASPAVPSFVRLLPNPAFRPEEQISYELIYRTQPVSRAYVTASAFFNQLDDMLSTELFTAFVEREPPPARLILPVSFLNGLHGNSHGVELTADVRPASWWRSTANYSYLRIQMTPDAGARDVSQQRRYEGLSPRHQVQVQTSLDLPRAVSLDWTWRYVSELPAGPVPAYATSNVRIAWRPRTGLEVALVGKDLHDERHSEWPTGGGANVLIQRSVLATVAWRH
jgi:iron complex outermembrane receptor protein